MQEMQDAAFTSSTVDTESRPAEALRVATEMHRQGPDWVTYFREILGVEGAVRQIFTTPAEWAEFERGPEYREIQQMLASLREKNGSKDSEDREPTRVITVRMPQSLHASLRQEAHSKNTSMNKLCISKLLQMVDEKLVPTD